jgi:hypothetical protein
VSLPLPIRAWLAVCTSYAAARSVQRIGRCLMPPTKLERTRYISPAGSTCTIRSASRASTTCSSRGARCVPPGDGPFVPYILARHARDPQEPSCAPSTTPRTTVGAIVGAAVGALHGRAALPQNWIDGLLGRTTADDDGRVFELLALARQRWG